MHSFDSCPEVSTSLVEEDRNRIADSIERDFIPPDSLATRDIGQAMALLESKLLPIVFTAKDLGYIQDRTRDVISAPRSSRYRFAREQLHAMNRHAFIRTLALGEVVQVIEVRGDVIHEAVSELGMEPAMPAGIMDATTYHMNQDRYDKDQVTALHTFLKDRMTPPPYVIAETKILAVTKISGEALRDIKHAMGISETWYKDPESGEGRPYLSQDDTLKVLKYIKDPEYRKSILGG